MTFRQSILQKVYPVILWLSKLTGGNQQVLVNVGNAKSADAFSGLTFNSNNGQTIAMSQFAGRKVLVVNTASDCGFTAQFSGLQQLADAYKDRLVVLGFPANDFKEQEKGDDSSIASFCSINYGVKFLLAQKSVVVKGAAQNEVFKWLSDKQRNGWNDVAPGWNFTKYLVNENGQLTHVFATSVDPSDGRVKQAIETA